MRKTTLALALATTFGGLALAIAPASAAPMAGTGIHADGPITQVRMTRSERMMMKQRMMRKKMMHRKMMHRRRMMNRM